MKKPPRPLRLVVLDLDGTTLNPHHGLSPATIEAIREVSARGIRVVLASGRLPHSVAPFARQLGLTGLHLGLNGGVAFDHDQNLRHKHLLNVDQLRLAHELIEKQGLEPVVFGAGGIWAVQRTPDIDLLLSYGEPDIQLYQRSRLESIVDPVKVLTVLPSGPLDAEFERWAAPMLHTIRTGPSFFEFMPPGVTKGAALTELLDEWGIDRDETLAIGDSENDESLFDATGFAVAMGNAVELLKAKADALTATNAEDGVAQALRRWVL